MVSKKAVVGQIFFHMQTCGPAKSYILGIPCLSIESLMSLIAMVLASKFLRLCLLISLS